MNSISPQLQPFVDYFKQTMTIPNRRQQKNNAGAFSLLFAGSLSTYLGYNYLRRSSFFEMKDYVSLREAIAELHSAAEDKEICTIVQGKVIKVLDGDGYTAINKSCVELRSSQFDESSGNWKDQVKTLKTSIIGYDFILLTPSGLCITVKLPKDLPSSRLKIPYLTQSRRREISRKEKEELCEEIAMVHLSDESFDTGFTRTEEVLSVNQHAYLSGVLSKKNGQYVLTYSEQCKLTVSSKELKSLNKQNQTNGLLFILVGIGLLAGGYIRYSSA